MRDDFLLIIDCFSFLVRLQRIQEERSRRNTFRGTEDSTMFHAVDTSNNYEVKVATSSMGPPTLMYFSHGNEKTFVPNGSPTTNLQYNVGFPTYATYQNSISGISNPVQPTVPYYGDALVSIHNILFFYLYERL